MATAEIPKLVRSIVDGDVKRESAQRNAPRRRNFAKYENIASDMVVTGSRFVEIFETKRCTKK